MEGWEPETDLGLGSGGGVNSGDGEGAGVVRLASWRRRRWWAYLSRDIRSWGSSSEGGKPEGSESDSELHVDRRLMDGQD